MTFTAQDFKRLEALRARFLDADSVNDTPDYWKDERDLELYHASFGERIGWKWDAVLAELQRRHLFQGRYRVLDVGCGSGIAMQRWLARNAERTVGYSLQDRSSLARDFAARELRARFPTVAVDPDPQSAPLLVLVSHVLSECSSASRAQLLEQLSSADLILWVEPGSQKIAQELVAAREQLRERFHVQAPCTHSAACGLAQATGNFWCHHFASPPRIVFQNAFWHQFSRTLGIDLRALPYSFLALERQAAPAQLPEQLLRVLGRPREEKGRVRIDVCSSAGVRTENFLERYDRVRAKELAHEPERERLYVATREGERIRALDAWPPA